MYAFSDPVSVGSSSPNAWHGERDYEWLSFELEYLWNIYFNDVNRANPIKIRFGRPWKWRLGMIALGSNGCTTITVNSLLRHRQVPWFVPTVTIAHELVHYAHGFGSPLERKHAHPHKGNIVPYELAARGLGKEHSLYERWTAEQWHAFYHQATGLKLVPSS